jgi:hypothetical protein
MRKIIIFFIIIISSITVYSQETEQLFRHLKRAETAYKLENYKDAITEYENVIKIDPGYADAYYNLAVICEKLQTDYYLQKAIEYYKKYMKLIPAEKDEITEKIYELEYHAEKKIQDREHFESILGFWRTTNYNLKSGQPDCIIEIAPFQGKLRIKLLQNSKIYTSTFTNIVATAELYKESLLFTYTDDKSFIPNPAKWDILAGLGSLAGGLLGGTAGQIISGVSQTAASAGSTSEQGQGTNTRNFYDFYISDFGTDTLKGFLHQFGAQKDFKTNNTRILIDDVTSVKFVRGSDFFPLPPKPVKPKKGVVTTLGFNAVFSFLEHPNRYDFSKANFGGSINLDFIFITKKSVNKNTKSGFSMGFEFLLESAAERIKYTTSTYLETDVAWNFRYFIIGGAGMTKIADKAYFMWGIKPVGFHVVGYGSEKYSVRENFYGTNIKRNYERYMWGLGVCGSVDLGLGFQISEKCVINLYTRGAFALDFFEQFYNLYRRYINFSVFPVTVQVGISFSFYDYKGFNTQKITE